MDSLLWPILFGLLGFIEPCAVGTTLLFVVTLEGKRARDKLQQVVFFTLTRTVVTGLLGVLAALVGAVFLGVQKAVWLLVGLVYAAIGLLYVTGRISVLKRSLGPRLASLSASRGSALLGALFALNIPACAGPLLVALLASAAAHGATGMTLVNGFVSLALFGLALSLPIVAAVLFPETRRVLDRLSGLSRRIPFWTGLLFVVLGIWSIWFGLFVSVA
jgi:cytochrome c-type biogenesis protein